MKYKLNEKESVEVVDMIAGSQLYTICSATLMGLFALFATESISVNFIGYSQPHWCKVPELQNLSFSQQKDIAIPYDGPDQDTYSSCQVYSLNYSQYSLEDLVNWNRSLMVDEGVGTMDCDQWVFDRSLFATTFTSKHSLVCGRSWMVQLVSTLFMAGILLGAVASGAISDRIGRKKTMLSFLTAKILVSVLCALAPNYPVLLLGRILLGLSSTGCFLVGYVLSMEHLSGTWRSVIGTVYMLVFSCGYMVWSGVAYAIRDQLKAQIAMTVPQVFFLLLWWPLAESPHWLMSKEKYAEAEEVFLRIATINGATLPEDFSVTKIEKEEETTVQKTCLHLFRSPTMRWRTLIIYFHWFVDSLMYYALSLNTASLAGSVFVNTIISGAVEIPANILCVLALNWRWTGRRLTCGVSLIVAGVASFIAIPIILRGDLTEAATAMSMIGKAFVTVGFTGIYLYSVEIFPTEVRNVGLGTSSMCARISGMAAPYVGGPLSNVWKPLPSAIFGVLATLAGVLTLFLPETLGTELFDTIEQAESFGKKSKVSPLELAHDKEASMERTVAQEEDKF